MSLIAFLSSAIGGTLLSGVTQLANEWFALRRLKVESEVRMNEAAKLAEIKMDEAALKAFQEAQRGAVASDWKPTDRTPVWLTCAFGLAEITIKLVRPLMVVGAFALIAHTYNEAQGADKAELATAVQTFAFSIGYFWIGQRYQVRLTSAKKS